MKSISQNPIETNLVWRYMIHVPLYYTRGVLGERGFGYIINAPENDIISDLQNIYLHFRISDLILIDNTSNFLEIYHS